MYIMPDVPKKDLGKFSLENQKKLWKKSIFRWKSSKFSKYIGQGVPLPPLQKNFIADLDELEHAKKNVKMSNFWDDPPPVVKIHIFCFEWEPPLELDCFSYSGLRSRRI